MIKTTRYGWAPSPDALTRGKITWGQRGKVEMSSDPQGPDPIEILEDGFVRWYRRPGHDWESNRPRPVQMQLTLETEQRGLF